MDQAKTNETGPLGSPHWFFFRTLFEILFLSPAKVLCIKIELVVEVEHIIGVLKECYVGNIFMYLEQIINSKLVLILI